MPRSFRLINPRIGNNVVYGRFVYMAADIEYRKDDVHNPEIGRVSVPIPVEFMAFAGGADKVKPLLCYYAIQKLKELLSTPSPELTYELELSEKEFNDLITIDSSRINPAQTVYIDDALRPQTRKIFISCGQYHANEKELGDQIKKIIDKIYGFEGYFAEYQQSLEGLTKNIFNALNTSASFVAVMHRRDIFSEKDYRASVWIEQEIAIAAFMVQTLAIPLLVKAYVQKGIRLEGVRGLIQFNPKIFENNEEVINDLNETLPSFLEQIKPLQNTWWTS